ncbi:hypothetical protein [Asaia platycodi]|uniref:hypothetical protein n=1 Tax=Asaia platycodi TaxID=610243 RepID=UPI000553ED14|nr:hypothetical protein [Asaia platycodi]
MDKWLEVAPERPTTEVTVDVTFLERLRRLCQAGLSGPRAIVWSDGILTSRITSRFTASLVRPIAGGCAI